MTFKKVLSIAISTAMIFSMSACGSKEPTDPNTTGNNTEQSTKTETEQPANSPEDDSDTIVIGGIGPKTGEYSAYGNAAINGAKLAFEEVETLLGKKIVFEDLDSKSDVTEAVNNFNKLANNSGAVAIIGAVTSDESIAIADASQRQSKKLPIISPTGTSPDITTYGTNVFRACYIDPTQGEVMANFAFDSLNLKKVAILYNNESDYSEGLTESFTSVFEGKTGEVVATETFSKNDSDFSALITKIASKEPEAIFFPNYYEKAGLFVKQLNDAGLKDMIVLGADGWDGVLSVVEDTSLLDNVYFCNHYSEEDENPEIQEFIKKYKETYNTNPNAFAPLGYDAAKIMIDAIEKAGSTDNEAIIEALKNTDLDVLTSNIKFDEDRNPIKDITIVKIKDGKNTMYEKLKP